MATHLPDLKYAFYGGGADAEYTFLLDAYAAGVTAVDLISAQQDLDAQAALVPSGVLAASLPYRMAPSNGSALSSGRISMQAIGLRAGITVTNISFWSATTAANTPTNWWFFLADADRNFLAISANQLTAAWAANTQKTLAMGTPYLVPTTGLYYAGLMVAATTPPTIQANNVHNSGMLGRAPILSGTSNTGQTTPPALPFQANALAASGTQLYCEIT